MKRAANARKSELATIRDTIRKLEKSVDAFPRNPSPRRVHKLRTRIHQFQTDQELVPLVGKKQAAPFQKALRRIRKRAGKVRDLDVFASRLASLHSEDEEDCLVRLLLHIGGKRRKQAHKLSHLIEVDNRVLDQGLKNARKRLSKVSSAGEGSSRLLNEQLAESLSAASRVDRLNRQNLHDHRKVIKHARDIITLSAEPSNRPVLEALGKAKDSIGEWHDWEELQRLARTNLTHGKGCKLMSVLGSVSKKKFAEALGITKGLKKLLDSKRIRSTLLMDNRIPAHQG